MCPVEHVGAIFHTARPGSERPARGAEGPGLGLLCASCAPRGASGRGRPSRVHVSGDDSCDHGQLTPQGPCGRNLEGKAAAVVQRNTIISSNFQNMIDD